MKVKNGALVKQKPKNKIVTAIINFTIAIDRLKDKRKEIEERNSSNNE